MSKLAKIQKAVEVLSADEVRELTVWLLTKKVVAINDKNKAEQELFKATIITGTTTAGKSVQINKLFGNRY